MAFLRAVLRMSMILVNSSQLAESVVVEGAKVQALRKGHSRH